MSQYNIHNACLQTGSFDPAIAPAIREARNFTNALAGIIWVKCLKVAYLIGMRHSPDLRLTHLMQ